MDFTHLESVLLLPLRAPIDGNLTKLEKTNLPSGFHKHTYSRFRMQNLTYLPRNLWHGLMHDLNTFFWPGANAKSGWVCLIDNVLQNISYSAGGRLNNFLWTGRRISLLDSILCHGCCSGKQAKKKPARGQDLPGMAENLRGHKHISVPSTFTCNSKWREELLE